jgi:hypothetical protein
VKNLLSFLFKGQIAPPVYVRRVNVPPVKSDASSTSTEVEFRSKLIMFFSWVLAIVLILCLFDIFVLTYTGKTVPDFIPPIITGIIGYFGGAIVAYLGIK